MKFVRFSSAFVWHLVKNKRAALPFPFKNDTTMKVLLLGRALVFRASQGGFIYVCMRVQENEQLAVFAKKMLGNFN